MTAVAAVSGGAASSSASVLAMRAVSKRFGATQALDGVDLELRAGEVHALLGENGAGKSTLIKIMTGLYRADTGQVLLDGEPVQIASPAQAQRHGIVAIYQEPLIFGDLTVAENIFMGHTDRGRVVRWRQMHRDAARILANLDVELDTRAPASTLTVGQQQALEIAKAMSTDVRVLIMDEPTAALSAHEVELLFRQVIRLREAGVAVLFISHRLGEVFEIADRISVFRDGRHISTRPVDDASEEGVVREMVGRELSEFFQRSRSDTVPADPVPADVSDTGDVVLSVSRLSRAGAFYDVSFEARRGEVLGFAGLVGAGRTDVALALFGIAPANAGVVEVAGEAVTIRSPRDALGYGIAYLSEDRRKLGLSLPQGVSANITLPTLARYVNRFRLIDGIAEDDVGERFRDRLDIRTAGLRAPVGDLSGGNQQRTMLAKWLNTEPRVLVLDEPTRGIDVGAKADVHRLIDELANEGMAVILISSDLPEVMAMSDRIAVMREGRLALTLDADDADQTQIMTTAIGTR